ncbi:MAG: phosphatase PAP2 family protein [Deltaproteobacteria bacterium]|nr:phosphatase PAP2 family protein [Deltaproteobacteria bacterium]
MQPTWILIAALTVSVPAIARADDDVKGTFDWRLPKRSYVWDGGAVPFLYLPLALTIGLKFTSPRAEPLMFASTEGGAHYDGGQYPSAMLYVGAGVAGATILLGGDDSRWHHVKGFLQGVLTTQLLTHTAKNTFGRHRPHYDLAEGAVNDDDRRRSFWSGHSSSTLATATYLGLYARYHLFNRWRPPGTLPWWEVAAYTGLAVAALAVPYSQYALNRHHASDVITGGLVGAGVSTLFFVYQERRYRRDKAQPGDTSRPEPFELSIVPNTSINGITIVGTW